MATSGATELHYFVIVVESFTVLGSTQFSRAESKQVSENEMSAEFKKGLT